MPGAFAPSSSRSAADSLRGAPTARPSGSADLARRINRLMLLRTLVVSGVLALSYWLTWVGGAPWSSGASALLTFVIVATYVLTLVYALLLRRGIDPESLVWPQLIGDLLVTSALVWVTGAGQSAYSFFFALSIVGASTIRYRSGVVVVASSSAVLIVLIFLAGWSRAIPLPMVPQAAPWTESLAAVARDIGINVAALAAVGALSYALGDQLQRAAASLADEQRAVADLVSLHLDIVRSLTSGLVTTDSDWRILTANQAAAEILGASPQALIGKSVDSVMPGLRDQVPPNDPRQELRRADLTIGQGPGEVVLGVSVSPLRDIRDRIAGRVINFQDLTDLRRMEVQVRRADRLATLGQLAAGIAHEIRNPLASISGSIELLRSAPQVSEDDRALMTIVNREIDRLNRLITDLLDYANPRPREVATFDFAVLVAETTQVFRQDRSRGTETTSELPGTMMITGDPSRLRQVVWNLLRNAADAASKGGGKIVVRLREEAGQAILEIIDNGPGIPAEVISNVFDPFFSTKSRGTGLGLAICHSVVTEHGGSIDLSSAGGEGTTATVRLPIARNGMVPS